MRCAAKLLEVLAWRCGVGGCDRCCGCDAKGEDEAAVA